MAETSESFDRLFPLLAGIAASDLGQERQRDYERCMAAYGVAMTASQLLEFTVKLAAPSLTSPVDDEEAAQAQVQASLGKSFADAIKLLVVLLPHAGLKLDADFGRQLHGVRTYRNGLAHDWLFEGPFRIMQGDGASVLRELEQQADRCAELTELLITTVIEQGLGLRGLSLQQLMASADALSALALDGSSEHQLEIKDGELSVLVDLLTRAVQDGAASASP
ncbi:MAG: hypothetical protein JNK12_14070 [Acidimicrobiales bacterium]|nr:hypothetical protein [Acidimicrobiales bacterium]